MSYVSWQLRMTQKLKRNWLVALKLTWGTPQILTQTLESLKKLCFNWVLVTKVVWTTKVQKSYLSWHWRDMQILKKNLLVIWKKTWEIWQIFTRALESVKIGTMMGSFCLQELCVMTMKNNAKFEEELTCHFKTDMRNLTNFDSSTRKSKKFAL